MAGGWRADIKNMDNKQRKGKASLKNLKAAQNEKFKNIRNSTTKTPKYIDSTMEHKTPHLSKFKSQPMRSYREMTCSITPLDTQFHELDPDSNAQVYVSQSVVADLLHSHSEKTVDCCKHQEKAKCGNKSYKPNKRTKAKKDSKCEERLKSEGRGGLTTRKSSANKDSLRSMLIKTERVLLKYQQRE